ncbi:MAG: WYL domain-containing protein, partial [Thermoleophilia bacterium]
LDPGAGPEALRANLDGASPLLAVLLEAVSGRKRVVFSYRPPGRDAAERRLDPYALVNRRGTWYVVGHDADRDALRSFRVSRIASDIRKLRPTSRGADFEVPAGFDPGKLLPTAGEPEGAPMALVRAARATARLAELRGAVPTGPPRPDGLVTLRLPVGDRDGLLGWAMGNSVEIVEPADLRQEARRRLEALAEVVGR